MGTKQDTPTEAHHVESVRDSLSDYATTALCKEHHQGATGVHGLSRRGFEAMYKLTDIDLLAMVARELWKSNGGKL
jgi:hypothetical protein